MKELGHIPYSPQIGEELRKRQERFDQGEDLEGEQKFSQEEAGALLYMWSDIALFKKNPYVWKSRKNGSAALVGERPIKKKELFRNGQKVSEEGFLSVLGRAKHFLQLDNLTKKEDKNGQRELQEAVLANIGLLKMVMRPFLWGSEADREDLFQYAAEGLLQALKGYEPEEKISFPSYAAVCIRNRIQERLKMHGDNLIRESTTSKSAHVIRKYKRALAHFRDFYGRNPESDEEFIEAVAEEMHALGIPMETSEDLEHLRNAYGVFQYLSLQSGAEPPEARDASLPFQDINSGEDEVFTEQLKEYVQDIIGKIQNERTRKMVCLYFGIKTGDDWDSDIDSEGMSLREVGQKVNLTKQQVSNVLRPVFARLKSDYLERNKWSPFE